MKNREKSASNCCHFSGPSIKLELVRSPSGSRPFGATVGYRLSRRGAYLPKIRFFWKKMEFARKVLQNSEKNHQKTCKFRHKFRTFRTNLRKSANFTEKFAKSQKLQAQKAGKIHRKIARDTQNPRSLRRKAVFESGPQLQKI